MSIKRQQIVSVSNASLDLFPGNSLSSFTHVLPKRMQIQEGETVMVALNTIVLDFTLQKDANNVPKNKVSYIKIHLKELDPATSVNQSDNRVLARLPVISNKINWTRSEVPIFYPLSQTREVIELTYTITDQDNNQLLLEDGLATLIQIEMTTSRTVHSFSITLDPEISEDLYSSNSLVNWHTNLPESFSLDSNWEVCLHNITVPRSVFMENTRFFLTLSTRTAEEWIEKPHVRQAGDAYFGLPLTGQTDINELELIQSTLNKWLPKYGYGISMIKNDGSINVVAKQRNAPLTQDFKTLLIHPFACYLLKIDALDGIGKYVPLPASGQQSAIRDTVPGYNITNTVGVPTPAHIAIYCDLVEPSIIGNAFGPIVDVVPTDELGLSTTTKDTFYAVKQPVFRSVNPYIKNTVQVAIRTLKGETPPFMHDPNVKEKDLKPLSLTFVFRRIK